MAWMNLIMLFSCPCNSILSSKKWLLWWWINKTGCKGMNELDHVVFLSLKQLLKIHLNVYLVVLLVWAFQCCLQLLLLRGQKYWTLNHLAKSGSAQVLNGIGIKPVLVRFSVLNPRTESQNFFDKKYRG